MDLFFISSFLRSLFSPFPLLVLCIFLAMLLPFSCFPVVFFLSFRCQLREGVRRNALRVLRPKSPHSEDSAHESQSGPLRSSWLSGERRNGGKPNSCTSFILQAHFDEGAVVIYYGVLCEPPFREVGRGQRFI